MKNKIIKILTLSAVLVLSLCFMLACDKGNNNSDSVHEHDYKEQVYYATCEAAGVTVYTCACGDTYTQEIQPLGHNYIYGYCSNCGAKDPNAQTHTHNYTASVVYPTCIDDGSAICTCTCGESYGVVIPALNHVEVKDNKVEPTCTEDGLTEGSHCSRCGDTLVAQEEIEALGHTYENSNQCSVCGYVDTQYFTFTLLENDTYSIAAADVNNIPAEVVLPSTYNGKAVTSIGEGAFYDCSSLTSVVIPDSVTTIGEGAFYDCSSLTSVVIPDSVTTIGYYAFYGCSSLSEITLPFVGATKDGTNNTNFGYIFGASSYLKNSSYVPTSLKKVTITGGTSIGSYAFYNCSRLTSVVIPDSVTFIGSYAFEDCRSLTSIKYRGTQTQWDKITKGNYWNRNIGYYTITYNYTGE